MEAPEPVRTLCRSGREYEPHGLDPRRAIPVVHPLDPRRMEPQNTPPAAVARQVVQCGQINGFSATVLEQASLGVASAAVERAKLRSDCMARATERAKLRTEASVCSSRDARYMVTPAHLIGDTDDSTAAIGERIRRLGESAVSQRECVRPWITPWRSAYI
jgi:hypothetical protein